MGGGPTDQTRPKTDDSTSTERLFFRYFFLMFEVSLREALRKVPKTHQEMHEIPNRCSKGGAQLYKRHPKSQIPR